MVVSLIGTPGNILLYVKYVQKEESYFPYIMIIVQVCACSRSLSKTVLATLQ